MSKSKKDRQFPFWASAKDDCREQRFAQIGNSLFYDPRFQSLSVGARHLYFCCILESGGKKEFQFPAVKIKALGLKERSTRSHFDELIAHGFIEKKSSGQNTRTPNDYLFSQEWRKRPQPINKPRSVSKPSAPQDPPAGFQALPDIASTDQAETEQRREAAIKAINSYHAPPDPAPSAAVESMEARREDNPEHEQISAKEKGRSE